MKNGDHHAPLSNCLLYVTQLRLNHIIAIKVSNYYLLNYNRMSLNKGAVAFALYLYSIL